MATTSPSSGDDFAFEVSIDGAAFLPLVTVASPVPQTYLATLPAAASGAVCIRVVDTRRTPDGGSLDRVCIDCMGLTPSAGGVIHIDDLLVTHRAAGTSQVGVCTAWVRDQAGDPVNGATVHADHTGPLHGSASGVTGPDGSATIESPKVGPVCEEWCFEVTGVTHAARPYDPGANVVTSACESGWFLPGPSSPLAELRFGLGGEEGVRRSGRSALHFTLPEPAHVELLVFSVNGRRAATLVDGWCAAGRHAVDLAAARLPSGVHFVRLEADGRRATRRVVWVR